MPNIGKSSKRPWLIRRKPFERNPIIGELKIDTEFYNSSVWRKISKRFRIDNPLCIVCKRDGIINVGNVVDHIKPSRIYPELKEDESNLQTLCTRHHNIKSQIESKIKNKSQFDRLITRGRGAKLFITKTSNNAPPV